jgi:hypothetical protein
MRQIKNLITAVSLLMPSLIFAQGGGTPPPNGLTGEDMIKANQYLPPTPEAAGLGKYGGIPLNLSSGAINLSVPLTALSYKGVTVPITLNYNSNGIKVDQYASRVGMGWVLSAGGVITREMRGAPDAIYQDNLQEPPVGFPATNDQATYDFLKNTAEFPNQYNTQPDIFNYNFCGQSGRFYIAKGQVVKTISHSNLKIEVGGVIGSETFTITTPDGVIYRFGGANNAGFKFIEKSKNNSSFGCAKSYESYVNTSWYLKEIQLPYTKELIEFVYQEYSAGTIKYITNLNESTEAVIQTNSIAFPTSNEIMQSCEFGASVPEVCATQYESTMIYLTAVQVKNLVQPAPSISFLYQDRLDIIGEKLLSKINTTKGTTIVLNYMYPPAHSGFPNPSFSISPTTCPFLADIHEESPSYTDENGNVVGPTISSEYAFEYENLAQFPSRHTMARDFMGYFNGVDNIHLIPQNYYNDYPGVLRNAAKGDRSFNEYLGKSGLLKKVTYPTGGNDVIDYQPLRAKYNIRTNPEYFEQFSFNGALNPLSTSSILNPQYNQNIMLFTRITSGGGIIAVKIFDILTNSTVYNNNIYSVTNATSPAFVVTAVNVPPGSYKMVLTSPDNVQAEAWVSYHTGMESVDNTQKQIGGYAVNFIETTDNLTGKKLYKYYKYSKRTDLANNSMVYCQSEFVNAFVNKRAYTFNWPLGAVVADVELKCPKVMLSASPINNTSLYGGGQYLFTDVLESTDPNGINGYTENEYLVGQDNAPEMLAIGGAPQQIIQGSSRSNTGFLNGMLKRMAIYKAPIDRSTPFGGTKISEEKNDYALSPLVDFNQYGYNIRRHYKKTIEILPPTAGNFDPFDVTRHYTLSEWPILTKTTKTMYDENGLNPIETVTDNIYSNPLHTMATQTITDDAKNGRIQINMIYPDDDNAANNFPISNRLYATDPTNYAAITWLKNKNVIVPIIKETKRITQTNTETLITQYEKYEPVDVTNNGVAADKVGLLKKRLVQFGTQAPETRVLFDVYNNQYTDPASLLQQHKADDIPMSYIWGFWGRYPTAEVANANYNQIAYCSFELGEGKGNFAFTVPFAPNALDGALAGISAYPLSAGNISWTTTNAVPTDYRVSCWVKNYNNNISIVGGTGPQVVGKTINGFTYCEWNGVSVAVGTAQGPTITITGSTSIDELRIAPMNARMTTICMRPDVGPVAKSDPNGNLNFYQYDGLGRLILIKDQEGNIIKTFDYKYKVPQ